MTHRDRFPYLKDDSRVLYKCQMTPMIASSPSPRMDPSWIDPVIGRMEEWCCMVLLGP